ncbi:hypothetical protein LWI29_016204 [Acer saccharum]|uniref:PXMP2/4 family protein 4 n=1 Tax=Acer saccharum TaxID=4024 RepID=A0AA39RM38_ACESA|nr:hypothetical protein LWI29_016204 [Acer saccharum]KAK1553920.1 hypothetical protein Q3G72_005342 [Acer saccharum]
MNRKCKSIQAFITNRCLLRFSEKQFLVDASHVTEQWKYYSRSPFQLRKIRNPKISSSLNLSSHSHSNSSNSNSTKIGFLGWYLAKLHSHPLITKGVTTSLIYVAADLTSQMIASEYSGSIDLKRTLRMAAYGMLVLGPTQHFWFNSMSKVLPQRDTLTSLKKLFMGQAIFGPCITSVFFSYNAALQGENGAQIVARLKRDLLPTLVNGLLYWPICDFVTYKYIPVHLQPLVNSSCSYVWTIYLTYMASLTKVV